jgi:hypothetical protein
MLAFICRVVNNRVGGTGVTLGPRDTSENEPVFVPALPTGGEPEAQHRTGRDSFNQAQSERRRS